MISPSHKFKLPTFRGYTSTTISHCQHSSVVLFTSLHKIGHILLSWFLKHPLTLSERVSKTVAEVEDILLSVLSGWKHDSNHPTASPTKATVQKLTTCIFLYHMYTCKYLLHEASAPSLTLSELKMREVGTFWMAWDEQLSLKYILYCKTWHFWIYQYSSLTAISSVK